MELSGEEGGDAFPENDRGSASWQSRDPLRVLVVAGSGLLEDAAGIAGLFVGRAFEGIEFVPLELADLEQSLGAARAPDVVMTFGTGALPLPQAELASFVEDGGGYVHWAGWSRLVADAGPVSRLLVLEPDVEPRREPRDIVFLVDGSGSMKGPRWIRAKAALGRLLPSVPPRDRFELRFFTQVLGSPRLTYAADPEADPGRTEARRREALRSLRDIEVPGGSTDIAGSVAQLASRLEEEGAGLEPRSSLVVLLTDGVPTLTGEDPGRVRARLTEAGHELVVIQVGERRGGPTRTLLRTRRRRGERPPGG